MEQIHTVDCEALLNKVVSKFSVVSEVSHQHGWVWGFAKQGDGSSALSQKCLVPAVDREALLNKGMKV